MGNGYLDSKTQKAFLSKISGCQDHNLILGEIIYHAKSNNRTIHVTWFDLEDAFGSVLHELISASLDRMNFPVNVRAYIAALYDNLRGKIRTPNWVSEEFNFRKGVFQGDPLSPIIFLICFNPILDDLKKFEASDGYRLNDASFITLPFADDFNLITRDIRKHKKLMARLHELTTSMGLKLKPRKCRSLSVKAGKSEAIVFGLGEAEIASILNDKYHKFLGGFYTYDCSAASVAGIITERMGEQLKNIDNLLVRNEYKARIYSEYLLGSYRFLFSIHDLNITQIKALNDLTHSYLKTWLGMPKGATWALVHDSHGLNIKSVEHLYKESRALSLSNVRFFSDDRVRHALDSKEEREGKWSRKFSSAIFVKGLIEEVVPPVATESTILTEDQSLDLFDDSSTSEASDSPPAVPSGTVSRKLLKGKIQTGVQDRVDNFWKEKVGLYIMQGDYLALIMEEGNCVTWKSFMWDIPQGVLKFAINAGINTLPTLDNLKRWGKRTNDRCPFCGNIQTLLHVLVDKSGIENL